MQRTLDELQVLADEATRSGDPLTQAIYAARVIEFSREHVMPVAARLRRDAVRTLRSEGWTLKQIGDAMDPPVSPSRIVRILEG